MTTSIENIRAGSVLLEAELAVPPDARGLVIFAHGSGSGRHSPRNRAVAARLQEVGMATLLVDLLSVEEDAYRENRFDIALLARRLDAITRWADGDVRLKKLPVGYFGASTGAAAAMVAAASQPDRIGAIVSRGGRVDLAAASATRLKMPVLFIVGGEDYGVMEANELVSVQLLGVKKLAIIPGATHLFEEPGALGQVADLAAKWFAAYLG